MKYHWTFLADKWNLDRIWCIHKEQYWHNNNIFHDHYDRTEVLEASINHFTNMVNGQLKQELWFKYRSDQLYIKPLQEMGYIDEEITYEEKNKPDFVLKDGSRTFELKWYDTKKDYMTIIAPNGKEYLYNNMTCKRVHQIKDCTKYHKADYIIIVLEEDGHLIERQFILDMTNGNYFKWSETKLDDALFKEYHQLRLE